MNYAFTNPQNELSDDKGGPPKPPSLGSCALALAFVLSILSGMTGGGGGLSEIATGIVLVAVAMGVWEVGQWAYLHFKSRR